MIDLLNLNFVAVLAVFIVNLFIGAFWYSPVLFGRYWKALTGVDHYKLPGNEANRGILLTAIGIAVQTIVTAVVVGATASQSVGSGIALGLLLWAGFVGATSIGDTVYARRGIRVWAINASYYLVALLIGSIVFSIWR